MKPRCVLVLLLGQGIHFINWYSVVRQSFQLSFATWSPDDPMQVTNVGKDLGVLMNYSFSRSIYCREAVSTARRVLLMIKRSIAELSVSTFTPLYNPSWRRYTGLPAETCCRRRLFGANPAVGNEACIGFRTDCHMKNNYVGWV